MRTSTSRPAGFATVEIVLAVVVLVALGCLGWWVYQRQTTTSDNTAPTAVVSTAPPVKSSPDLDTAARTLDQNDPTTSNNTDLDQLDSQLNNL